ncbi:MAG: hypothetical protein L0H96_06585 [Humibacillus sp.]|nr:hypothetical protein [Humibacillus sp.]MDN5776560.1 hypothetical protein [Humibacillus sp.]
MARPRPLATDLPTFGPSFDTMCEAATVHWRTALPASTDDSPIVVVDLLMQDLRLALRTLTLANGLRRLHPARLVALVGPNRHWLGRIWDGYNHEQLTKLARSYGADEVLDVAFLSEQTSAGVSHVRILGTDVPVAPPADASGLNRLQVVTDSTSVRILRVPRRGQATADDDIRGIERFVAAEDRLYRTLFAHEPAVALVTSHVNYGQWALAIDAATASGVPVVHAQATGGLKAYALFPGTDLDEHGFRRALSVQIAQMFDEQLWKHRDVLGPSAEWTAWRSRANLGRPSWWRSGGEISRLDLRSNDERQALRSYTLNRLGLDPSKRVVTVFNHAISDAVQGNHEAFIDLATWLEETITMAARNDAVSWLFLDHPSQVNYDRTEHFEHLATVHADVGPLAFRPSLAISRNALWSVTDLAVTVRGSVSSESPAYGVPALQAGWSEWSHLGISRRTDTVADYVDALSSSVRDLAAGRPLLTPEQVRRARLWLWLYRSGADVTTPLVPNREHGQGTALHQLVTTAMNHVEDDADPAYTSVQRLWSRSEPVLTRMDLSNTSRDLAIAHALAGDHPRGAPGSGLRTTYDETPVAGRGQIRSGRDPVVRMVEGFVRGGAIVGRASHFESVLVLETGNVGQALVIEIELALDPESAIWWHRRSPAAQRHQVDLEANRLPRHLSVGLAGVEGIEVVFPAAPGQVSSPAVVTRVSVMVPANSARLSTLVFRSSPDHDRRLPDSVIGLRINSLTIAPGR